MKRPVNLLVPGILVFSPIFKLLSLIAFGGYEHISNSMDDIKNKK